MFRDEVGGGDDINMRENALAARTHNQTKKLVYTVRSSVFYFGAVIVNNVASLSTARARAVLFVSQNGAHVARLEWDQPRNGV